MPKFGLHISTSDSDKIEKIKRIIVSWKVSHGDPVHGWHNQECCIEEILEELEKAMKDE